MSFPRHDCASLAGAHSADCQLAIARGSIIGYADDFRTRKCAAWLDCGNLDVPVSLLSFRGFCPGCEAVARGDQL